MEASELSDKYLHSLQGCLADNQLLDMLNGSPVDGEINPVKEED